MNRWVRIVYARLQSLFQRRHLDQDLDDELHDHLTRQTEANVAAGMTADEARRAARVALGGLQQQKELCREARGLRWLQEFAQDARYAWRTYRKAPGFTATALLTLGLAIGSTTAVFSLLNALVFRELPVRNPDALVRIQTVNPDGTAHELSYDAFRLLSGRVPALAALVGWWGPTVESIQVDQRVDRAGIFAATGNMYDTLGVRPVAGRLLTPADMALDPPRAEHVAVLGYECWQRLFGGSAAAIGQTVRIQTVPFTVIGVTPPGFTGFGVVVEPEITIPLTAVPLIDGRPVESLPGRSSRWITTIGRLRPSERLVQAQAELAAVWPHVRAATAAALTTPADRDQAQALGIDVSSAATGIEPNLRARYRQPLLIVLIVALLIMMIASLNFAGLVLARTASRQREIGVRLALGAGAARIARQLLTEASLLAFAGMLGGLLFANVAANAIAAALLRGVLVPVGFDPSPDRHVFAFAAILAMATAVIVSLAPAWRLVRLNTALSLRSDTRTASVRRARGTALMLAQIAATVVLLMTAGLLARTLQKLRSVDPGKRVEDVTIVYPDPVPGGYAHIDNDTYLPSLVDRIARIPGVADVCVSLFKPGGREGPEDIVSAPAASGVTEVSAFFTPVSPGFFRTLGIRLVQGRDFAWTDNSRSREVGIISRSLERALFGAGRGLGAHVRVGRRPPYKYIAIIGVVADARIYDIRSANLRGLYTAALQQGDQANYKALLVRAARLPMRDVRAAVASLGHDDVLSTESMAFVQAQAILPERLTAMLAGFFGLLGLSVAAVGLYGRMSYDVTQRAREIGIRMALGAKWGQVMGKVLRDGLVIAGGGAAIGFVAGLGAVRVVRSLLFGIGPYDPLTLAAAVGVLLLMTAAACLRPAFRAARLDPLEVLRQE